jgi:hypothetical protein
MSENVFELNNPLGMNCILSQHRLDNHILTHHPEMKGKVRLMRLAISNPDFIIKDRRNYFSFVHALKLHNAKRENTYLTVRVSGSNSTTGLVNTSFIVSKFDPNKEGEIIYEKDKDSL